MTRVERKFYKTAENIDVNELIKNDKVQTFDSPLLEITKNKKGEKKNRKIKIEQKQK